MKKELNAEITTDFPVTEAVPALAPGASVAEILNTSSAQVYALVRRGELKAIKIGRRGSLSFAVTVDGRPLHTTDSVWTLPRYSCGYNWTSPAGLQELLAAA